MMDGVVPDLRSVFTVLLRGNGESDGFDRVMTYLHHSNSQLQSGAVHCGVHSADV